MWEAAKARAKKSGVPFDIDIADIAIPERCPILGVPLKNYIGSGKQGGRCDSASLDRKVPELGYVRGNVWVVSRLGNLMKQDATPEQLRIFADWITRTYGKYQET
jgi:hypothetical protein